MTLSNLRKTVVQYRELVSSVTPLNAQQFELLKGLPFYDWGSAENRYRGGEKGNHFLLLSLKTFNHAIGLPQKEGRAYPLFDYEQMLFDTLQKHRHVWVKKATGLGVTEFMLRYMAWLCLSFDSKLTDSQMCIVTGPRIELAITLIDRMKGLFRDLSSLTGSTVSRINPAKPVLFDTKETVIELNGVHIEAYPSHHLDSMRGLKDVSFIYLDEADFFPPGQQQDARDVSERYIAKSNPWIVMVSTPNSPEQLFDRIEKEPESTCLYKRILLDYTYGLNRIYTQDEIDAAKQSPSFEREYNLKYLGLIGNVFHTKDIEAAMERGKQISENISRISYTKKSMGLDPGFGSSPFGVCITELRDGMVNVLHAEEYQRPDFNQMIDIVLSLIQQYNIHFDNSCRIFTDGANPEFIRALKARVYEDIEYEAQIDRWKSYNGANVITLRWLMDNMFVLPVSFAKYHKEMLAHTKKLMEYGSGVVAINPDKHTKLITALRTAVEKGEGSLDKEATSHSDVFDAFRMSLQYWIS